MRVHGMRSSATMAPSRSALDTDAAVTRALDWEREEVASPAGPMCPKRAVLLDKHDGSASPAGTHKTAIKVSISLACSAGNVDSSLHLGLDWLNNCGRLDDFRR